jgi:heme A synthase
MSNQPDAPSPPAEEPERRVRRGCLGVIVITLSALFIVGGQTGMSWATIGLLAVLAVAVVGLLLVTFGSRTPAP